MLEPIKHTLDFQRIVLASASPRRREILHHVGLRFEVRPSLFNEDLKPSEFTSHANFAVETAYRKVLEVADRLNNDANKPDIIIGADTVVSMDGKVFGKPENPKAAEQYLKELSGREHTVYTGVVIKTHNATVKFHESCKVFMTYLSDDVIKAYIRTREPLDKAGAYGIQGFGGSLIERINGDFYTVMGLPLHSLCKHLVWLTEDRVKRMELSRTIGAEATDSVLEKRRSRSKSRERESKTQLRVTFKERKDKESP